MKRSRDSETARPWRILGSRLCDRQWLGAVAVGAVLGCEIAFAWQSFQHYRTTAAAPHVISPVACILTIGAAVLVGDGLSHGFLAGERASLLLCWAGLLVLAGPIPMVTHVVLFLLVLCRTVRFGATAVTAPNFIPISG